MTEPLFKIDKKRLAGLTDAGRFLWIMSQTDERISAEVAFTIIFNETASIINYVEEGFESSFSDRDYVYMQTDDVEGYFYMHKREKMVKILSSLCKMGLNGVVKQFLEFDERIHKKFMETNKPDVILLKNSGLAKQRTLINSLYAKYAHCFAGQFPEEYRNLLRSKNGYAATEPQPFDEWK